MSSTRTVLLIAGPGRSGSTLIERILGNQDGYFSVGEARYFWEFIGNEHRLCGCGNNFKECSFWSKVIRVIEEEGPLDNTQLSTLSKSINKTAFLPVIYHVPFLYKSQINKLSRAFHQLYTVIFQNTADLVIVDSSKIGTYAKLLMNISNIDLRVIHLVRDSRAVAYSWKYRKKKDPSLVDIGGSMRGRGLIRSALSWMMTNYYLQKMKSHFTSYSVLRYEDFIKDPTERLNHSLAEVGLPIIPIDMKKPIDLLPTHSVGGNPLRFNSQILIEDKSIWRGKLTQFQKYLVGLVSYPIMKRFNYHLKVDIDK